MTTRAPRHDLVVTCPRGAEDVCASELDELGVRAPAQRRPGRVRLRNVTARELAVVAAAARTAERVWVVGAVGRVATFAELEQFARRVDWSRWIDSGEAVHLHVDTRQSRLMHTTAIAERVLGILNRPVGDGRMASADGQVFRLVVDRDRAELQVDATGAPAAERGWRVDPGPAPLAAAVAAVARRCAGWRPGLGLLDPMCGSGTIVIDAAREAAGLPVHVDTRLAHWPSLNTGSWTSALETVRRAAPAGRPVLIGSDISAEAAARSTANAARAGVGDETDFVGDVDLADADRTTERLGVPDQDRTRRVVISNPPWGRRLPPTSGAVVDTLASLVTDSAAAAIIVSSASTADAVFGRRVDELRLRQRGVEIGVYSRTANPSASDRSVVGG